MQELYALRVEIVDKFVVLQANPLEQLVCVKLLLKRISNISGRRFTKEGIHVAEHQYFATLFVKPEHTNIHEHLKYPLEVVPAHTEQF